MDTKYAAIAEWARSEINSGRFAPGDRFYSEGSICEQHGVSRQTVRQALDILEQEGFVDRRRGSGTYVRAQKPAVHAGAGNVGVVSTYFSDYIFPSIITGIEHSLSRRAFGMQLAITHNRVQDEAAALRKMQGQNVSALIVEPTRSALPNPNRELYQAIRAQGIPLVFFNARYAWAGDFPLVAMDDVEAGRLAAQCLIDAGHKKIAAVMKSDDMQGHLRYQGYLQALGQAGLPVESQRVLWYATEDRNSLFSDPQRVAERFGNAGAVVCYNDEIAVRLLGFCKSQGWDVPGRLSVVGIDDATIARLCEPTLCSVTHPKTTLGECAAEAVLALLDDPAAQVGRLFTPKLVLRESVGRPKPTS